MNFIKYFVLLSATALPLVTSAEGDKNCSYTQCYYYLSENRTQEAIAACTQAVDEGAIDVADTLGTIYQEGIGDLAANHPEAVKWYRYAAEKSAYTAQWQLGMMYYTGQGLPQDLVEAYAWLDVASRFDDSHVIGDRDKVAEDMSEGQLSEASKLSAKYNELYSDFTPPIHCGKPTYSPRAGK